MNQLLQNTNNNNNNNNNIIGLIIFVLHRVIFFHSLGIEYRGQKNNSNNNSLVFLTAALCWWA